MRGKAVYPSEAHFQRSVNTQVKEMTAKLTRIMEAFKDASPEIMIAALEPTFQLSQLYVPENTGALKESGYLRETSSRGKPRVEMGYGFGHQPPYAQIVHERTDIAHTYPTRAKYLQDALQEDLWGIQQRLATGYRRFMNG
jgi:hypothetical protein